MHVVCLLMAARCMLGLKGGQQAGLPATRHPMHTAQTPGCITACSTHSTDPSTALMAISCHVPNPVYPAPNASPSVTVTPLYA